MTIPQHIIYGAGGTVSLSVASLPSAGTVTIKSGDGATIVDDAAVTVSTISTTLDEAAARGARSITVADATGIASGSEFQLSNPAEVVRCKSVSGAVVTLWRPLLHSHADTTAVSGINVSYTVLAADADSLFFDGRCEWTLDDVLVDITSCECTKYPLLRPSAINAQHLSDELPDLAQLIDVEVDSERLLDDAFNEVLEKIGGKARVRVYTGSNAFRRASVFAACAAIFRHKPGDSARELYERYTKAFEQAAEDLQGVAPRDEDQDGVITERERITMKSGLIFRA